MKIVACALLLFLSFSAHSESRMWKAEKQDGKSQTVKTIYVLGVTHFGLRGEYDHYLSQRVIPAFEGADSFFLEKAAVYGYGAPDCPHPLTHPDSLETIAKARLAVREMSIAYFEKLDRLMQDTPSSTEQLDGIAKYMSNVSEIGLMSLLNLFNSDLAGLERKGLAESPRDIPNFLIRQSPGKTVISLDVASDIESAYCGMGEERISLFRERTGVDRKVVSEEENPELYKNVIETRETDFQSSIKRMKEDGVFKPQSDALKQNFICARNQNWIKLLQKKEGGNTKFAAVGLSHLLRQNGKEGLLCNGLLKDLELAGYSVSLVRE